MRRQYTRLRVVALTSGSKESVFAMMKCREHGHSIVAIANPQPKLTPASDTNHPQPEAPQDKPDSSQQDEVRHTRMSALAEAMGMPLFERAAGGTSGSEGQPSTDPTHESDAEHLYELLLVVKQNVPNLGAVCIGAILSDHQRVCVEAACERLGLLSLAYLWQRKQRPLLDEMLRKGVHAIVVKVASNGLDPAHLGSAVGDLRPALHKLHDKGGGFQVCGEFGEYETFIIDCPLFRYRIDPTPSRVVCDDAGSHVLKFSKVELLKKKGVHVPDTVKFSGYSDDEKGDEQLGLEPPDVHICLSTGMPLGEARAKWAVGLSPSSPLAEHTRSNTYSMSLGGGLTHVGVYGTAEDVSAGPLSSAQQLTLAMTRLRAALAEHGLSIDHALVIRLYLGGMAQFDALEAAYSAAMGNALPAARIAVQLPLPRAPDSSIEIDAREAAKTFQAAQVVSAGDGQRATHKGTPKGTPKGIPKGIPKGMPKDYMTSTRRLSLLHAKNKKDAGAPVALECVAWAGSKEVLQVGSLTEWAPRAAGPCCQVALGQENCHVAGSIGLFPPTMTLVDGGTSAQTRRALRNCAAVLGVRHSAANALALLLYVTDAADAGVVHAESLRWLRHVTGRPHATLEELPPISMLQVDALSMGACVEAQLEATATSARRLFRGSWTAICADGIEVSCDAVVGPFLKDGVAGEPRPSAVAFASFLVNATSASRPYGLGQICLAISVAVRQLRAKLLEASPTLAVHSGIFARLYYAAELEEFVDAFSNSISNSVHSIMDLSFELDVPVFPLPVKRVLGLGGLEQLAVHLHFALAVREPRSEESEWRHGRWSEVEM